MNNEPSPYFGEYPPDFFDFIVIDECHRSGAKDESSWRGILEYFAPAVHLGLTATPKRKDNADTYKYFGEASIDNKRTGFSINWARHSSSPLSNCLSC